MQRAVLTYIYQKPDFRMSPETLSAFLATQEPSLLSLALLIRSKEIGRLEQAEKFAPYTRHDDSSVRQAALLAMLSAGIPLPPVSAFDCFAATRHLQRDHYEFGFEARLANAMERAIVEADASIAQQHHINLEMPLIHLLQRIDVACPGYLEQIMQTGPGCFERFCTGLPNAKQDYCSLLTEALGATRGPVAIWHFMHGGVNHTWFSEGVGASVESTILKDPRAVSYEEMAQILFDSCSTSEGTVECGHITLFLDACYQYSMAEQLQCHLEKLAQESGRALVSYPLVTSISQALMRGKIEQVTDDLEKPSLRYFAPRWHSALREGADDDKRITVEDLLSADNSVHQAFDETIADPRTLRHSAATEHIKDWKKPDSRGLKGMWGEAPAIFGPGRVDLRKELEEMIERLNEDADLKIPAVPDDARLPKYTFLEIG